MHFEPGGPTRVLRVSAPPLCLESKTCRHPNVMVSEHIPSRQLSHGETVSINNVTVYVNWTFHRPPPGKQRCVSFQKRREKEQFWEWEKK